MKIGIGYFLLVTGAITLVVGIGGAAYPEYREQAGWRIIVGICFIVLAKWMVKRKTIMTDEDGQKEPHQNGSHPNPTANNADYYKILGISSDASQGDIKAAQRKRAASYNTNNPKRVEIVIGVILLGLLLSLTIYYSFLEGDKQAQTENKKVEDNFQQTATADSLVTYPTAPTSPTMPDIPPEFNFKAIEDIMFGTRGRVSGNIIFLSGWGFKVEDDFYNDSIGLYRLSLTSDINLPYDASNSDAINRLRSILDSAGAIYSEPLKLDSQEAEVLGSAAIGEQIIRAMADKPKKPVNHGQIHYVWQYIFDKKRIKLGYYDFYNDDIILERHPIIKITSIFAERYMNEKKQLENINNASKF